MTIDNLKDFVTRGRAPQDAVDRTIAGGSRQMTKQQEASDQAYRRHQRSARVREFRVTRGGPVLQGQHQPLVLRCR